MGKRSKASSSSTRQSPSKKPKTSHSKVFVVVRVTEDGSHGDFEATIDGVFDNLAAANETARKCILDSNEDFESKDDFDEWEEKKDKNGRVNIEAHVMEGEWIRVHIEEREVNSALIKPKPKKSTRERGSSDEEELNASDEEE